MNGLIYQLSAPPSAAQLAVSLYTLRQRYDGPVTLFAAPGQCADACAELASASGADVKEIQPQAIKHGSYVQKPTTALLSPYERTAYLDADTLVCGSIDPLFGLTLNVTPFACWKTTGKIYGSRIRQWLTVEDSLAQRLAAAALNAPYPAVNTGVFSFHGYQAAPLLAEWLRLTTVGTKCSYTDEYAMQLLVVAVSERVIHGSIYVLPDDRFNWSVRFGIHSEPVVLHYHGRKHARAYKNARNEQERWAVGEWWETFDDLWSRDWAHVRRWALECDTKIAPLVKERVA